MSRWSLRVWVVTTVIFGALSAPTRTPGTAPAPAITSISPTAGPIGTSVVIAGSGFGASQAASVVTLNGAPVTINSWSDTSITITIPSGASSGPLLVSVAPSMTNSNPLTFTVTSPTLPSSWLDKDVGAVSLAGSASYANGVFTVKASGEWIWSTADGMHFAYQPLSGDGAIIARVLSAQGSSYPEAGVMIRETLTADSAHAYVAYEPYPGPSIYLDFRSTKGASTSSQYTSIKALPYWVKLVRSGNTFSGYLSADGSNWVQAGATQTISMAQNVYIGLAVSANNNSFLATATFDNVSISTPAAPTYLLSASATSMSMGSVLVGGKSSQSVVLTNTGTSGVSISQVAVSGAGFTFGGLATPLTLAVGQSAGLTVTFSPTTAGSATGSLSVVSNATNSPATIALSGAGIAQTLQLGSSTKSLSFGSVLVGTSSSSQSVAITNTGNSSVTISGTSVTGTGFTASGIVAPLTLAAGQSVSVNVAFLPATTGSVTATLSVASNAANSPTTISLAGTGVQPQISVIPGSVAFGNVAVGTTNTQTMTIQNTGTASLSVSQVTVGVPGFSLSGLALPLSLAPGSSGQFTLSFAPASATAFSGSLSLVSNTPGSPSTVPVSGTGLAPTLQLSVAPTALSFGAITVDTTSASRAVTISNTGNSTVNITQIGVSGTSYSVTGAALPLSLSAGQSTTFNVAFTPLTAGTLGGKITVVSNATNSPATISLSGSGVQTTSHSTTLSWSDSSTGTAGFNIYRGTVSGGPYTKINSALILTNTFTDGSVQSGTSYYYVATAVDSTGSESTYSNEAVAVVP